jgi:hypothetical protein
MTIRTIVILIALAVGLVDLIVMRRRGGLRTFRDLDMRKASHAAWKIGAEDFLTGIILTPNIALALVLSRPRMRFARLKHLPKVRPTPKP